jgi:hypothetical protein
MADVVNLINLEPGDKLSISNGATVEVATNPKDGVWVFAKYLAFPDDPSLVGTEEMFFAQDIVEVLESA